MKRHPSKSSIASPQTGIWPRRRFLRATAAAAIVFPFVRKLRGAQASNGSPNSRLNHACIGVEGMGASDLQNFLKHPKVRIVALCDVDSTRLNKAAKGVPEARLYTDWRELLAKEGAKIDS